MNHTFQMRKAIFLLLSFVLFQTLAMSQNVPTTVPSVDLARYAGKWYEIASFPQRFQKGCYCTTAEYILSQKGYVIVVNRCRKDSANGRGASGVLSI